MEVTTVADCTKVPPALNPELAKFLARSTPNRELPLAVRRFMTEIGCSQPEEAMQLAAERALAMYAAPLSSGETFPSSRSRQFGDHDAQVTSHVSVERLCAAMNVDLIGAPQKEGRSVNRSDYETMPYWQHPVCVEFTRRRPTIRLPLNIGWNRGRVAAAHEIGHVLIHRREDGYDEATIRLGSTSEEEALAEYASRLLLLPKDLRDRWLTEAKSDNYALTSVIVAHRAQVSLHTATARLGDPDIGNHTIRGAIFWRMANKSASSEAEVVLTPYWHLCPGAYVPVGRCKARKGSLIGEFANETDRVAGSRVEEVNVGTLQGRFLIDAFAWGSRADRTRVVLSVFRFEVGN
jgi:hypothetical protein